MFQLTPSFPNWFVNTSRNESLYEFPPHQEQGVFERTLVAQRPRNYLAYQ